MDKEINRLMEKLYTPKVYYYILEILDNNKEKYTRNCNGVFFNVSELKRETAEEILLYLSAINNTMTSHMEYLNKIPM